MVIPKIPKYIKGYKKSNFSESLKRMIEAFDHLKIIAKAAGIKKDELIALLIWLESIDKLYSRRDKELFFNKLKKYCIYI